MALVDTVDEPAGKIRVLTGIALSHVKADKDAAPLLEALLQQLEALMDDAARREALADVNEEFAELADYEALTDFQAALFELEQTLNPVHLRLENSSPASKPPRNASKLSPKSPPPCTRRGRRIYPKFCWSRPARKPRHWKNRTKCLPPKPHWPSPK